MRAPVIYLSCPISNGGASQPWEQHENVRYASEFAHTLRKRGYGVINPASTWYEEKDTRLHMSHPEWIDHDFRVIEVCDALFRMPGESTGADQEVEFARSKSIWVFDDLEKMNKFFKERGMLP